MRKFHMKKKAAVVVAAAALTVTAAGGAYAYWTTTGAGSGFAANASSNGTIVLHAAFDANTLTPGGSETVTYTADNAGTSNLRVGTVHPVVSTDNVGCSAGDFTIADLTSDTTVPAKTTGVALGSGTLYFADSATKNQDACKGAVITLTLTSN